MFSRPKHNQLKLFDTVGGSGDEQRDHLQRFPQGLGRCSAVKRTQFSLQWLTTVSNSGSKGSDVLSCLCRHHACTRCTDIHAGKTCMHAKKVRSSKKTHNLKPPISFYPIQNDVQAPQFKLFKCMCACIGKKKKKKKGEYMKEESSWWNAQRASVKPWVWVSVPRKQHGYESL